MKKLTSLLSVAVLSGWMVGCGASDSSAPTDTGTPASSPTTTEPGAGDLSHAESAADPAATDPAADPAATDPAADPAAEGAN